MADGDDLTQRSAEPGQLGDDQLVARLQDGHQLIEPAAGFGGPSRGGRFDKVVDVEVVLAGVLENGETLAASVLLRGRDPEIGDGFHGLLMESGFRYLLDVSRPWKLSLSMSMN